MALSFLDFPEAFSTAECETIVALAARSNLEPATVWSGVADHVDTRTRQAERCYWPRGPETAWIYDRLDALFAEAGTRFETEVDPVFEDIQFVRYGVGAHFQTWHSDAGTDRYEERRISASVELSEAGDYDGGVLEIMPTTSPPIRVLQPLRRCATATACPTSSMPSSVRDIAGCSPRYAPSNGPTRSFSSMR